MPAKFYFTTVAARPLTFQNRKFSFLVCSTAGGRANGVFATEDAGEQAVLDAAVQSRRGVKEIGADEYEQLKKKATKMPASSNFGGFKPRIVQPPILPQMAVEGRAAAPHAGQPAAKPVAETLPPSPTIGSLVKTQKVASPKPFANSEKKTKQAADRAKIRVARRPEST
jgi:hypothetical protein